MTSAVRGFFLGLREVFTLEQAERRALAVGDEERARRERHLRAARARRASARKLSSPVAAIILLRDALVVALEAATPPGTPFDARERLVAILGDREDRAETCRRVTDVLAQTSSLALDELPFSHAETLRASLEDCIAIVIGEVDTRSIIAIRVIRVARIVAMMVLVLWLVIPYVREHYMLHNIALGKAVTSSPLLGESPTPDHVVDGETRGTFGIATMTVEHPFIIVDLAASYEVDRVRIVNRGDGWFDDSVPLVLGISDDGVHFTDVARRDEHFDQWTVGLGGRQARFVRVSMPEHGYIALNEIEVYAR